MSLSLSEISIRLVGLGANHATSTCTWISNTAVLLPGSNRTCNHKNWTSASKGAMIGLLWDAVMIFGFCFRLPESTLRICFFLYFFVGCVIPIAQQKVNTCSFLFWVISGFCKASPKSTFEFAFFLLFFFGRISTVFVNHSVFGIRNFLSLLVFWGSQGFPHQTHFFLAQIDKE